MLSKIPKSVINVILIVMGTLLMALSINFFLLPNKITTGGASGIATILYYKLNINMGLSILLINIPLFIVAIKKFGIKFSFKSIMAIITFTIFLDLLNFNEYFIDNKIDIFIAAVYGGLLLGIGISLVFKAGTSTGGSDLLAQLLRKKDSSLNLSKIILAIDLVVITSLIVSFKNLNLGLYSVIAIYISSKMIDIIFEGVNYAKVINIVTKNDTSITDSIIKELKRGATVTKCIGAYTKDELINITCIVRRREIGKVKRIVYNIDSNAFIYISNTNEVLGKGFKNI